jgi:hypothetical protein
MDTRVYQIIKKYRDALSKSGIQADRIILFGSHAFGEAKEYSDIDLVVISNDFKGVDLIERLEILGKTAARIMEPVEALGYTEEEFSLKGKGTFIGDEVKAKGTEI